MLYMFCCKKSTYCRENMSESDRQTANIYMRYEHNIHTEEDTRN